MNNFLSVVFVILLLSGCTSSPAPISPASQTVSTEIESTIGTRSVTENEFEALHKAIKLNDIPAAEELINSGFYLKSTDQNGKQFIHWSAYYGRTEITKTLIDKGVPVDVFDNKGHTPLYLASEYGHLETVKLLIERGAAINRTIKSGSTPLIVATNFNHKDVIFYLVEKGADPGIGESETGAEAIILAVTSHDPEIVELFLKKGANPNVRGNQDLSPLSLSALHEDLTVFDMLIDYGAEPAMILRDNYTALSYATEIHRKKVVEKLLPFYINPQYETLLHQAAYVADMNGFSDLTKLFFKAKQKLVKQVAVNVFLTPNGFKESDQQQILNFVNDSSIYYMDELGNTLPHLAVMLNNLEMLNASIQKGIPVDVYNNMGLSPLHMAAYLGHFEAAETLIQKGARINDYSPFDKSTPLHLACLTGSSKIAEMLIGKNAAITVLNKQNATPLHFAVKEGYQNIIEMLLKKYDENRESLPGDLLKTAVFNRNEETALLLLKSEVVGDESLMALLIGAERSSPELISGIINKYKSQGIPMVIRDDQNRNALHRAALTGNTEVVTILIEAGVPLNDRALENLTPLYIASINGHSQIARLLIEAGANTEVKASNGFTALSIAVYYSRMEIVKHLIEGGADIEAQLPDGTTVIELARATGNDEMYIYLIKQLEQ